MIITLTGTVVNKLEDSVVVETGGIGYQVWVTDQDLGTAVVGEEVHWWIHESVKEDAYDLYGFAQWSGRELFERLLSVSGVGPKAALAILSVEGVERAHKAIYSGDVAFLQSASGIGKRTAERVAVELKDKLVSSEQLVSGAESEDDAALEALESLGYSRSVAARALANISSDLDEEARIKEALQQLS